MLDETRLFSNVNAIDEYLTIQADPLEVRRASVWLEQLCIAHNVPAEPLFRLDLCLNEVLANIFYHGGKTALSEPVFLQFNLSQNAEYRLVTISVSDAGDKFDLFTSVQQPSPKSLAEAEPGGLGLLLLRRLTDDLTYNYHAGCNQLSFSINFV